ncbi:MAG: hypothetical protein ACK5IJ_09640 [Mangrovibacterium sp.]
MTVISKMARVANSIRMSDMNSLSQAILEKTNLLDLSTEVYLSSVFDSSEGSQLELNNIINHERVKSDLTDSLNDLRPADWCFRKLIESTSLLENIASQAAGKQVLQIINRHHAAIIKSRAHLPFNSNLSALIADLNEESVSPLVNSITHAASTFARLTELQLLFMSKFSQFYDSREKQQMKNSGYTLRNKLYQLINNDLLAYLEVMSKVPAVDYDDYTNAINAIIKSRNIYIKKRMGNAEQSGDEVESNLHA